MRVESGPCRLALTRRLMGVVCVPLGGVPGCCGAACRPFGEAEQGDQAAHLFRAQRPVFVHVGERPVPWLLRGAHAAVSRRSVEAIPRM